MHAFSTPAAPAPAVWPFDSAEARRILRLAAPISLIALVNMAMSVTDTLMAAALGPAALAAVAVASDFYSILFYLVAGTIGGLAPLYAAAAAAGDTARLGTLRPAGWTVALGAFALAAPVIWYAADILRPLGIDPALLEAGRGYARVMAVTLLPNAVAALYRARLTALERPGLLLRVTLVAVPLNALGNWLLMFGPGPLPALGITGAALSSLLVWSVVALALMLLARRHGDAGGPARPDAATVAGIVRIGLPIGIAMLADVGLFLGATLYAGTLSLPEAAAHALTIRLAGLSYTLSIGLNQAVMVRSARAGDGAALRGTIASGLAVSAGVAVTLCVLLSGLALGASRGLGGALGDAAALAAPAIALLAVAELFGAPGAAADGVLRGRRDTRAAMTCALAGNWLIAAPVAFALTQLMPLGVAGLWAGLALGAVSTALMTGARLRRHWARAETSFTLGE